MTLISRKFFKLMNKNSYDYDEKLKWTYDQLKENILHGQQIARTSSWTYDIQKDHYFYTNEIYNILECRFKEFDGEFEKYLSFIHPDYIEDFRKAKTI